MPLLVSLFLLVIMIIVMLINAPIKNFSTTGTIGSFNLHNINNLFLR